jgi:nucleoside 2-deoxyribosyltransferase
MPKVYIAGSLRHSSKEWWSFYEKIAKLAQKIGFKTHVPHIDSVKKINKSVDDLHNPNLSLSIRANAYKENLDAVSNSNLLIAEVTKLSIGTGVEIGFALQLNKSIICLAQKDVDITSMVLGPVHLGLIKLIRYENEADALKKLEKMLKDVINNLD